MSSDDSSFDLSYLNPSDVGSSPSERGKQSQGSSQPHTQYGYSTPSATSKLMKRNKHKISPIDVSEFTNTSTPRSPKRNSQNAVKQSDHNSRISESVFQTHPELNMAMSQEGNFNPVKGARVLFSPKREINSYMKDYRSSQKIVGDGESDYSTQERSIDVDSDVDEGDDNEELDIRKSHGKEQDSGNGKRRTLTDSSTLHDGGESSLFTDPNTPYVLSLYLQLAFNFLIISLIAFFIFIFVRTIQSDIKRKIDLYTSDILEEISSCTREYYRNRCSPPEDMAPWLEPSCTKWKKCMNSDPDLIARSKITAETFADIVNGFIKPISWKSLIFLNLMVWGSLLATNVTFGTYRANSRKIEEDNIKLRGKVKELERKTLLLEEEQKSAKNEHKLIANNTYQY
ncbi:hypothetical protein CLIB1423_06S04016 [[Candida] railenensis]|uniref:Brl1/Brr6 domain-containing protein n=1 Tax=[Candida] railenensis TaxID=45579 RepID=A0A9P0QN71_9ASCO|nr:hypothetical protein CLIB1423_06S04016 [[Candida] railenensis]